MTFKTGDIIKGIHNHKDILWEVVDNNTYMLNQTCSQLLIPLDFNLACRSYGHIDGKHFPFGELTDQCWELDKKYMLKKQFEDEMREIIYA